MVAWTAGRDRCEWVARRRGGLLWAPDSGCGPSSGGDEGQAAVAVQLEQVVDSAVKAPLCAGGRLAAQQQPSGVLGGVHLAEDRFDDRLAPTVNGASLLGPRLARHPLLRGRVLGDRPAWRGRRWL